MKYRLILERAPFGPLPRTPTEEELRAAALAAQAMEQQDASVPRLAESVKLTAITHFQGVPAAGLVDKKTGKAFFLTEGQQLGDFTLEEVSFPDGRVLLTRGAQTEFIALSYAPGQPTNLVRNAGSNFLSVLDLASPKTTVVAEGEQPPAEKEPPTGFSPELLAAATTVDASGETRISFRELHRLRVQESREKAERERSEREARIRAEREQEADRQRESDIAAKIQEATEKLTRRQIIEAIKDGYDVNLDFELTAEEIKELAEAGFEIPSEDILSAEAETTPQTEEHPLL